jgi:hypothetical protein
MNMAKQRKDSNVVDLIEPAPDGFNISREEWSATPEVIRDETHRMCPEFAKGFAKYAAGAQRDATLAEFHDLAAASGKKLKDVIGAYVAMESLVRRDTVKGIELICQNAGLSPRDWALNVMETALRAERDALKSEVA